MVKSVLLTFFAIISILTSAYSQLPKSLDKDPWTKAQLIEPAALQQALKTPGKNKLVVFNIGVVDNIKGAIKTGAASDKNNLELFNEKLKATPKNAMVVVYCGCCPMYKCPNIRPAFQALQAAGFKNARLLNLQTNIKTDWISKGYPVE